MGYKEARAPPKTSEAIKKTRTQAIVQGHRRETEGIVVVCDGEQEKAQLVESFGPRAQTHRDQSITWDKAGSTVRAAFSVSVLDKTHGHFMLVFDRAFECSALS